MSGKSGRVLAAAAAALVLLAAATLYARADRLLDLLEAHATRAEASLGGRLRAAGVLAYWDFDALRVRELVGLSDCTNGGTRRVAGHFGVARAFLPGEHGLIRTAVPLTALGRSFTFSCWLQFPQQIPNQQVFQYLLVRDGRFVVRLPGQRELAGPAAAAGRFTHVAFTVDAEGKRVSLYVDGAQVADVALVPPGHLDQPIAFGQERYTPPPSFTLDEVSFWDRSLSAAEIARLARQRFSLSAERALTALLRVDLARTALDSFRSLLLAADLFNPFLHEDRVHAARLTSYALALSRNDVRHFNKYANEQQGNGLTAAGSSERRRIELLLGGRSRTALMELVVGGSAGPPESAKNALTLEILDDDGEPERKVQIRPVEGTPYLLDVLAGRLAAASAIPGAPPELCTVSINGTLEGIYLCSNVTQDQGPFWLSVPGAWPAVLRRVPFFREEVLREFDRLAASLAGALTSDRKSPLTSREILRDLEQQRRLLEAALADRATRTDEALVARVADELGEDLFLGANPHATLVVGDLDLSARTVNGAQLSFASLSPAVLGNDGRVAPPAQGEARAVLRVTVRSGVAERTRDLVYTVLAARRRLPILRVQAAGGPVARDPVVSVAQFTDGENRRGPLLEGRIRLRGNTALARSKNQKKYYRIALERPFDVPGVGRTKKLFLTSGWRDPTLLHDRLAYDLFRAFSEPGRPRYAPHVQPVELVVNGDYKGVYNLTDRVDADLLEFDKKHAALPRPVLYKAVGAKANFRTPVRWAYKQKEPDWRDGEHWGPFDELITFIGRSPRDEFREKAERVLDVDNVIDFEILLTLTSNHEGKNYNLFLARQGGENARFFIVPWDYDMTFYHQASPSNFLIDRLHRDLPGYSRRVLERWRALRDGLLSEKALGERLDGLTAELADAAARNYRRWEIWPGKTWRGSIDELRLWIGEHLRRLDAHFAKAAVAQ